MTLFRARRRGTVEWTLISISDGPEEEEDSLAPVIVGIIGSALGTCELHVQMLGEEGEWEDLE